MTAVLKKLPLHSFHVQAGGRMGHFGEWEVPLYFTTILDEHTAVRESAGLFDISHMGEFFVSGSGARAFLETVQPRRMDRLQDGKALYTTLLNESGGIIDDILIYQIEPERFLLIVNAGNVATDFQWLESRCPKNVELEDASERYALFALQGPRSLPLAERIFGCDFSPLRYYHFLSQESRWGDVLVSRTGYTGEDGLELMLPQSGAFDLWQVLMTTGKEFSLKPAGFGARDTLRLEAGMPLHGHDIDPTTSPVEANLLWAVDSEKIPFTGQERILREMREGVSRKLSGFEMLERGIPRQGFSIEKQGVGLGKVTSGSFSPTLRKNIGLGYVRTAESSIGNEIEIIIRDQKVKAKICSLPFYKRSK